MILVDTSVWIDFFRGSSACRRLAGLLEENEILIHPWVIGELALGHLGRQRDAIMADLFRLPTLPLLANDEILQMIDAQSLAGQGIGWVDAHLLGSALVAGAQLWTRDRRLARVASAIGICPVP